MQKKLADCKKILIFDPCLVISVLVLIILMPIGFTIDNIIYQDECLSDPNIYLAEDLPGNVPKPMKDFINNAKSSLQFVATGSIATTKSFSDYAQLLHHARDRGVKIQILTDNNDIVQAFNFTDIISETSSFLQDFFFFAVADEDQSIISSKLFEPFTQVQTDYLLHFPNCKSVNADLRSVFQLIIMHKPGMHVYPKKVCPGAAFPKTHVFPSGSCKIGISPEILAPPGREHTLNLVYDFFTNPGSNLYIATQSLFPIIDHPRYYMPELVLSESIEYAAITSSTIDILIPNINSHDNAEINSLVSNQNITIKKLNGTTTFSTMLIDKFHNCAGLMTKPIEDVVVNQVAAIFIWINSTTIVQRLSQHFVKFL